MTSEQCGKGIIPRSLILTDEFLVEGWSVVAVIFKLWSDIFGGNLCLFVTQFTKYRRPLFRMRFSIIPRSKLVLSAPHDNSACYGNCETVHSKTDGKEPYF